MSIKKGLIGAASVLCVMALSSFAVAGDFYLSGQVGGSFQANDSGAYGNNIAVDPDFPGSFEADTGVVGAIGVGYTINEQFRVEGRIGYRNSDINDSQIGTGARAGEEYILDGSIESTTFTIEAFYDFTNSSPITPYIKAGVGVAYNEYSARLGGAGVAVFDAFDGTIDGYYDNYADGDSTEFTWNIGAGATYAVTERLSIFTEYQYGFFGDVNTGQDAFTDGFEIEDIASHEISIGLRFSL